MELASSSSFLQALVFIFKPSCLQLFASISVFNFLHWFWLPWKAFSPLHNPPHRPAHSAGPITPDPFFKIFCVFLPSIFLLFFRLAFLSIFGAFEVAWGAKIKPKLVKICFGRGFWGDFHFCANFWQIFIDFLHFLPPMDTHFLYVFYASPRTCKLQFRQGV